MVVAGKMMCADIVNPNWIRASSSAVRPNMIPLFQYPGSRIWGPCCAEESTETIGCSVVGRSLPSAFKQRAELARKRRQSDRKVDREQQSDHELGLVTLPPEALRVQMPA